MRRLIAVMENKPMSEPSAWMNAKAQAARRSAMEKAGRGWALLGPELQEALVAREALALIAANEDNEGWERAGKFASLILSDTR